MILMKDIIREGNPILEQKAEDVKLPVSEEDLNTLIEMMEYIYNSVDEEVGPKLELRPAVGLAAPQIGISKKMIAISACDEKGRQYDFALINPKIISYSDELTYLKGGEGCLSVDREVSGLIHRPKRISFKALSFPYYLIDNLVLEDKKNFTHQIDHIVITQKGIYVIETKNYYGEISTNANDSIWLRRIKDKV